MKIKKVSEEIAKESDKLRHLQPEVENFFPKKIKIHTTEGSYVLVKSDLTREHGIIRCFYYHNTPEEMNGDVTGDGEPDTLGFDIYVINDGDDRRLKVDITYGDSVKYEFVIESPNYIRMIHYNGYGSKFDSGTHFGFSNKSIKHLIKVFHHLNPKLKLTIKDFNFIDKYFDTYRYFESVKITPLSVDQKIMVINNGRPTGDPYLKNILEYLRKRGIDYIVISNSNEISKVQKKEKIVGAILSGSDFRIMDDGDDLNQEALKKLTCPILAICFGFQSMCKTAGSKVIKGKKMIKGHFKLERGVNHHLFRGLDLATTKFSFAFTDYVKDCPQDYKVIAKIGNIIVVIANESRKRWGLLFHPEDVEKTEIVLDNFIRCCHGGQSDMDKIKRGQF